jgi:hypothetical protein
VEGKLTNQITSAIDLYGQYQDPASGKNTELQVIKHGKLAKSFVVLDEDFSKESGTDGPYLSKTIYRWNGRFYVVGNSNVSGVYRIGPTSRVEVPALRAFE